MRVFGLVMVHSYNLFKYLSNSKSKMKHIQRESNLSAYPINRAIIGVESITVHTD